MKALAFHIYEIVNVLLKPEIVHQSFSHTDGRMNERTIPKNSVCDVRRLLVQAL